jgi:hypothetical protein
MASPLLPCSSPLWTAAPFHCPPYNTFARTEYKTPFPKIPIWLNAYPFPQERVNWAVAYKWLYKLQYKQIINDVFLITLLLVTSSLFRKKNVRSTKRGGRSGWALNILSTSIFLEIHITNVTVIWPSVWWEFTVKSRDTPPSAANAFWYYE